MPDRLTEIRARLNAATPGPWRVRANGSFIRARAVVYRDSNQHANNTDVCQLVGERREWADADLIAHAPADIEWLLAENYRLQMSNEIHKEDVAEIYDLRDQVNALWDIVYEQDVPGVMDLYGKRVEEHRRTRRGR